MEKSFGQIALGALIAVALALVPSSVSAGLITCHGVAAGIVGTAGDDVLTGTSGNDIIAGLEGNDTIDGLGGNDFICGNGGNDAISGGPEWDLLYGGEGNDHLSGGGGDDSYYFEPTTVTETDTIEELPVGWECSPRGYSNDKLGFLLGAGDSVTVDLTSDTPIAFHTNRTVNTAVPGEAANFEHVGGGSGNDIITGNCSGNELRGGGGDDVLFDGDGGDWLEGGQGNDRYVFKPAAAPQSDIVVEWAGEGDDWLDFEFLLAGDGVTANLTSNAPIAYHTNRTISNYQGGAALEHVSGGAGDDNITGNAKANILVDGDGNDSLVGGAGDDIYLFLPAATPQTDTVAELAGGGENDWLDFINLPAGNGVAVNLNNDAPIATHTNRTINTAAAGQAANFEHVGGGEGNDNITGNAAVNILVDWDGNDTLAGGLGNDIYYFFPAGAAQTDTVAELKNQGQDWLFFSALVADAGAAVLSEAGISSVEIRGLTAGEVVRRSVEASGNREFEILHAADNVVVNLTKDTPIASHFNRTINTAAKKQAANFEHVVTGDGNDIITGNKATNFLFGSDGNDILNGGGGKDYGDGGPGIDKCKVEVKVNCP